MATILDPQFKLSWCRGATDTEHKEQLQEIAATVQLDIESWTDCPPQTKMKTDFIDLFLGSPENMSEVQKEVQKEVTEYLSGTLLEKDKNPLAFWALKETSYPRSARLVEKFLSIFSSAPFERTLSIGGKFFRPGRCRL